MWRPAFLFLLSFALFDTSAAAHSGDGPHDLVDVAALRRACRQSEQPGRRRLYTVPISGEDLRFAPYDPEEGALVVDTRRNLKAYEGSAELLPAHLETVAFIAPPELARRWAREARSLRLGFFLGFDERDHRACLLRGSHAIATVRVDVAFAELYDARGAVLARQDTERLRSWLDDAELDGVPGEGPRGIVLPPSLSDGADAPHSWAAAAAALNQGRVHAALAACHAAALERGAASDAQVVVRLTVETRSGRVREVEVELSSLGDDEGARCVSMAVARNLRLAPVNFGIARVDLSVPVRLAAD